MRNAHINEMRSKQMWRYLNDNYMIACMVRDPTVDQVHNSELKQGLISYRDVTRNSLIIFHTMYNRRQVFFCNHLVQRVCLPSRSRPTCLRSLVIWDYAQECSVEWAKYCPWDGSGTLLW
jgi:hypothetical protein